MTTCYIIDDESHAINILNSYINQTPGLELIGSNDNPVNALQEISALQPDIVFTDIEMPLLSGTEVSKHFDKKIKIVFTTAHPGFALEAFELGSYDYLLKPIKYQRFLQCIQRLKPPDAEQKQNVDNAESPKHIYVQSGTKGQMARIMLEDILYIESLNNYIIIHMPDNKHIVYLTLKEILLTLPESTFSRIHKSIIINDNKIRFIEGNQVIIQDKLKLTIGNSYREYFFNKIAKSILKRRIIN
ncbi:LytTR family DNA-binding domain-containing protein [Mucilaginibacter sp. CSA2-8R]|uniref:LytR/AlgR family response regulator transcription factor n=1 Tax=Mucilaginibacter sp. CSA2-8R TaxID=3141542 RepID=UPI00315E02B0